LFVAWFAALPARELGISRQAVADRLKTVDGRSQRQGKK
jgi:hypothetical protein